MFKVEIWSMRKYKPLCFSTGETIGQHTQIHCAVCIARQHVHGENLRLPVVLDGLRRFSLGARIPAVAPQDHLEQWPRQVYSQSSADWKTAGESPGQSARRLCVSTGLRCWTPLVFDLHSRVSTILLFLALNLRRLNQVSAHFAFSQDIREVFCVNGNAILNSSFGVNSSQSHHTLW